MKIQKKKTKPSLPDIILPEKLVLFLRNPMGVLGLTLVLLIIISAVFAPLFATHNPFTMDIANRLAGPSFDNFLGTDQLGRDTYTRVLYGGRVALQVAAIGVSVLTGCCNRGLRITSSWFNTWHDRWIWPFMVG